MRVASAGLAGVVLALAACASAPPVPVWHGLSANVLDEEIHDLLGTVEWHATEGARTVLVHLRQRHFRPRSFASPHAGEPAPWVRDVNALQRDLYAILEALRADGLEEVFSEGQAVEKRYADPELWMDFVQTLDRAEAAGALGGRVLRDEFRDLGGEVGLLFDLPHGPLTSEAQAAAARLEKVKYLAGAEVLMGLGGRLRVLPVEHEALLDDAERALRDWPEGTAAADLPDALQVRLFDRREDAIVEIIARHGRPSSALVLGGMHDLRDNVDRWNAANPGMRVTLAVVTPHAYHDQ